MSRMRLSAIVRRRRAGGTRDCTRWRHACVERSGFPFAARPMLATLVDEPFHREGWVYEEKYDGYRILAYKEGARVSARVAQRQGPDRRPSRRSPTPCARLRDKTLLLDGEAVAFDRRRVSRFQLLQRGGATLGRSPRSTASTATAGTCAAPALGERRRRAREGAREARRGASSSRAASRANGLTAYRMARRRGIRRAWSRRIPRRRTRSGAASSGSRSRSTRRRSSSWRGYTEPRGARRHLGALLLGAYRGKDLHFVGKVGTGFSEARRSNPSRRSCVPLGARALRLRRSAAR